MSVRLRNGIAVLTLLAALAAVFALAYQAYADTSGPDTCKAYGSPEMGQKVFGKQRGLTSCQREGGPSLERI